MVNPYQPCVFVYRHLPSHCEEVLIVKIAWISGASLPLKGGVGEHETRCATVNCSYRCAPRKRLHDGAKLWLETRGCVVQNVLLVTGCDRSRLASAGERTTADSRGHDDLLPVKLQLTQSFVVDEKESFVLDDGTANRHPVLPHPEGRDIGVSVDVKVVEIPCIEN